MNVCIQPTEGNLGPSVMVWGTIHHGGRSELVGLDGTLNRQCYIRFLDDSMLPRATGVFWTKLWVCPGQCHAPCSTWHNNCFSGTTWCEGYGRASSWTRHEPHWAWLGPNGCLDPRHGWPLSTVPELRYAVPQGRAAVCARRVRTLFESMPYRVPVPVAARGHTMYYCCGDMAVSMFNRFIETMVICHLVFFHDAIIWMCCFSTVELPKHYFLLFYQLQGQNEIGAKHFYISSDSKFDTSKRCCSGVVSSSNSVHLDRWFDEYPVAALFAHRFDPLPSWHMRSQLFSRRASPLWTV